MTVAHLYLELSLEQQLHSRHVLLKAHRANVVGLNVGVQVDPSETITLMKGMCFQLVDNQVLSFQPRVNLMCSTCTALPRPTDLFACASFAEHVWFDPVKWSMEWNRVHF